MKKFLLTSTMLALVGCGTIGNTVISDETLQGRAAFALDTTSDQVKITDRKGDMDRVWFVANVGDKSYLCYAHPVVGIGASDAICSGSNSVKKNNSTS